jgi:hypothetical protein
MDALNDCGCCEGPDRVPESRKNPVGAPAIGYRAGTHATFKAALLAHLSTTAYPALASLRTRSDDDFIIATCDAAALLLDVLTFYQERFANELYLRTATERRSLLELARLIGYQLAPGVAASVRLAFQLQESPGVPSLAAEPATIPIGTRVQSVPGPDEEPQTFETVKEITARVEWNAIPVQSRERQTLGTGTTEVFIAGVTSQVQTGDVILIVGDERRKLTTSTRWNTRVVTAVEPDPERGMTRLAWEDAIGANPAESGVAVYVFRLRTALFGHNAMDARLTRIIGADATNLTTGNDNARKWVDYKIIAGQIDLDGEFPKILPKSWFQLESEAGGKALFIADQVKRLSRAAYGLSGRITRPVQDAATSLTNFGLQETVVLAQSEELPLTERLLAFPLYGTTLPLSQRSDDLVPKQRIAVSGKRQRLGVLVDDSALQFHPDVGSPVPVKPGDSFTLVAAPVKLVGSAEVALAPAELETTTEVVRWRLADGAAQEGTLEATLVQVALQAALKEDPIVSEISAIGDDASAVKHNHLTKLELDAPLVHVYDRGTTTVCANLALATHGEAVSEIAGPGKADTPNQAFRLKQAPLTYVSASTPTGREATLEVRVDGLLWKEAESLFERGPREHVYSLSRDEDQYTQVQFGDGVEGARLPSGQDNVRFTYRKFLGSAGNLAAGRLTTLLGRPLGVKSATNPAPASGGEDPESRDDARRNAPLTMLTLGRAVSLQDYTDFARTFAGIAKAQAIWVGSGAARGIFITVAGPDGAEVTADSNAMIDLVDALGKYGDELLPLHVASYAAPTFTIEGRIKVADDALAGDVLPQVEQALRDYYSFEKRDFGQTVSIDEVMAVIHSIEGVEAADIDTLARVEPGATSQPRLFAFPAHVDDDGTLHPAELLTLDAGPLELEAMT